MPPKTQSFALPLQKRDSPDKCMEHLDVPSWPEAREPRNWVAVDSLTCLVNGVRALKGFWLFAGGITYRRLLAFATYM